MQRRGRRGRVLIRIRTLSTECTGGDVLVGIQVCVPSIQVGTAGPWSTSHVISQHFHSHDPFQSKNKLRPLTAPKHGSSPSFAHPFCCRREGARVSSMADVLASAGAGKVQSDVDKPTQELADAAVLLALRKGFMLRSASSAVEGMHAPFALLPRKVRWASNSAHHALWRSRPTLTLCSFQRQSSPC